ncbi:MAG: hypothetical protein Q4B68_11150 [Bacteroidales bacterium]|nr:hypothetical protein [Bacteroidales bacterium]
MMKKMILGALIALASMTATAQVVAEETAATNAQVLEKYQPQPESKLGYGIYVGGGYSVTAPSLNDNFGGCFLFQGGLVGTYGRFQLKTDLQFGQPSFRNDNIFNAPVETHDGKDYPSEVNGSSSASFFGWSVQLGYKVYSSGPFAVTPNAGIYYTKYSWNIDELKWKKNEEDKDPAYICEVTGTRSAKLSNLGFIASVDIDYAFSTSKMKNPFTGDGDHQFRQSIRFTPFVAYAKYDKCNPAVKGAFVGITINYCGILHSLGL